MARLRFEPRPMAAELTTVYVLPPAHRPLWDVPRGPVVYVLPVVRRLEDPRPLPTQQEREHERRLRISATKRHKVCL